ncbi:MAG: PhoP regulatory network YrbL family protein [Hyphomicrobiales bacterium]|nr:PhoP regulatory network YrbL family protein [Hyphomicrobiales bacterium]
MAAVKVHDGTFHEIVRKRAQGASKFARKSAWGPSFVKVAMRSGAPDKGIVIGAAHAHNIVYQDSTRRFVCIDGFGDKNTVPIHEMSHFANRFKLKRARCRLTKTIRELSA